MVTSISIIVRIRAPIRYFTQSGVVDWGEAGGGGDGGVGAGRIVGGGASVSSGNDSVVKAPTALQSL